MNQDCSSDALRVPKSGSGLRELHLFAGAGGGILGGILLGHTCVCAVEIEPYCRRVLLQRQRDGLLPVFPIWDDVRTFDGKPWRGRVDAICGGFPCQDIAVGSATKSGLSGERSGLWGEMARTVRDIRPGVVFVENSAAIVARGLGRVLSDLAALGYDAQWGVFSAGDVGARHERERMWVVADSNALKREKRSRDFQQFRQPAGQFGDYGISLEDNRSRWVEMASSFSRMDDAMADRVDRTCAIGNGQVPAVVALAWRTLAGDAIKASEGLR